MEIDIESISYCVCIVKLFERFDKFKTKNSQTQHLIYRALEICNHILEQQKHGNAFCTNEGNIAIIFASKTKTLEILFIREILKGCLHEIKSVLNINIFIAIGSIEKDYLSVYKSYKNACKTLEYHLILPSGHILEFDKIINKEITLENRKIIDLKELMTLFSNNQLHKIEKFIDNVFSDVKKMNNITPSLAYDTAVEMVYGILSCVKNLIYNKKGYSLLQDYSYLELFKLQSIEEIAEWIKTLARNCLAVIEKSNNNMHPIVKRVVQHMHNNCDDPILLKTLAIEYNTNASYLGQVFKEETGEFFTDYLNMIRIDKAKKLLSKKDLKSSDISDMVGFSDAKYFFKVFKKLTGVSPSEYKLGQYIS